MTWLTASWRRLPAPAQNGPGAPAIKALLQSGCWLAACLLLSACASFGPKPDATVDAGLPAQVELKDTPFFPQDQHQCGPASLATALVAAGFPAEPRDLQNLLYLPEREGSLQIEMLAAARRRGALATVIPPTLNALLMEVAVGRPVVVLQNLGLSWAPRWHYAVVIGYDRAAQQVILRSGRVEREILSLSTFGHTWARSGNWAMLVLPPGQMPLQAEPAELEKSLAALEKYAEPAQMVGYYEAASRRWPDNFLFRMGLGINAYSAGKLDVAENAFRNVVQRMPDNAAALNNLATVLQELGRLDEALHVADQAVSQGGQWQAQAMATRNGIRQAMQRRRE